MILSLHITPNAAKNQIIGWVAGVNGGKVLKIKIAAQPEDGKANAELIKFLAKQWQVPKSSLEIVGGEISRYKRLKVHDVVLIEKLISEPLIMVTIK